MQHSGLTVGTQVLRALARHPGRPAFTWDGGEMSYRGAAELIGRIQKVFLAHGLGRGVRVAVLSANRVDSWCASVAAHLCGATTTSLHPKGSFSDHVYQLEDSGAAALVIDAQTFSEVGGQLSARENLKVFTLGASGWGIDLNAAALKAGAATARDLAHPDDVATLNYTGGTTGKAKGIVRRHHGTVAIANAILADFDLPRRPYYLAVAPVSHVSGTKVLPTLMRGGCIHLARTFDPGQVLATIEQRRINAMLVVPTMLYTLLDEPKLARADVSSLELLLYGAAPISPARLAEGVERIGPVFAQLYGQTECHPIAFLPKEDHDPLAPHLLAACGFPVSQNAIALLDDEGRPIPAGEAGEICVRGPNVMAGYWNRPEETAEALKFGWLHTGDIARSDDEGRLYIVDRKKDMIITGGFNVFTRAVEDVLMSNSAVSLAAVIATPDARWGETVTAIVVRHPGAHVSAETLIQEVKASKGAAHAPKRVEFVDALPVTSLGKIDKKALRAKYWAGRSRDIG
ncbi:acyl-CoA synthetase [Variovorax sp. WS11]|nr:AMP-binding protein [Variovorax sp. WS11]NDZ17769.1 AMP-binding protein [Variovorax sp. WS11]PSL80211.1 acyl-CoA synthetase [Variovorax sp. WS11]